mmetsp:Transcript_75799/g.134251  ORF Transcript_75799/g.134251 Transcript_75799/m.134251 type:complete len:112 (-) Transcript_75799:453-788(-)
MRPAAHTSAVMSPAARAVMTHLTVMVTHRQTVVVMLTVMVVMVMVVTVMVTHLAEAFELFCWNQSRNSKSALPVYHRTVVRIMMFHLRGLLRVVELLPKPVFFDERRDTVC